METGLRSYMFFAYGILGMKFRIYIFLSISNQKSANFEVENKKDMKTVHCVEEP